MGWLSMAVASVALAAVLFTALQTFRAYRLTRSTFFPERPAVPPHLAGADLVGARDIRFQAQGSGTIHGTWVPSRTGAAVLLLHGSGADRTGLAFEARSLARAGLGVLAYDSPGHGASEGRVRWGEPERLAVRAALDWVLTQPDVRDGRVGALAFSMGTSVAVAVAASDLRIKALVLEAPTADAVDQTLHEFRRWGPFSQLPGLWAMRHFGFDPHPRPLDQIGRLAPRPLLLISGSQDQNVPTSQAVALLEAAGHPKELWTLAGVGHGGYAEAAPDELAARLASFFTRSLPEAHPSGSGAPPTAPASR